MRPRSAAIIAVRVIALWIAIQGITTAIGLIAAEAQFGGGGGTVPLWAIIIAQFLIAFVLWSLAVGIADGIARGTIDEAPAGAARSANTHAVAISVVGIILLVEGFTGLIGAAISAASPLPFRGFGIRVTGFAEGREAQVVIGVVAIALGLSLVVAAGDIADLLSRRYPEQEPKIPPAP